MSGDPDHPSDDPPKPPKPEQEPSQPEAAPEPPPKLEAAPEEPTPAEPQSEEPVEEIAAPTPEREDPAPAELEIPTPEAPAPEIAASEPEPEIEPEIEEEQAVEEEPHEDLVQFPAAARVDEPEVWPPELRPEDRDSLFGEPEIPMPGEIGRPSAHGRDAQKVLDVDLGRIRRTKRFGLVGTVFTVLFIAFILAPVSWVGAYLFIDAPGTTLMMQRAAEGQTIRHTPVPFARMSPNIVRAVIAGEDSNFCTHHGFDVEAIQNALESNADGEGPTRGGSTISQQTAKNLFLWSSRDWLRKGLETYFTALMEFMWPKRRIMEQYLNNAEWGDGYFGIEAAAEGRFGVHASDLTPLQAARLAAVLPSPNRWKADSPGPYVRRRSATLVDRAITVRNIGAASCVLDIDPKPAAPPAR